MRAFLLRQVVLLAFVFEIHCLCIEQSFTEAEITVCSIVCSDQEVQGCVDDFVQNATEVNLHTTVRKFRKGTFKDLPYLKNIYAMDVGLEIIYPGAFLNLPSINTIDLSHNNIEDIVSDVFTGMSVEKINLGSNNISYIYQMAFSNMPNLKYVSLKKNNLDKFNKRWFTNTMGLEVLDLSHNSISSIWSWSFDSFPNLKMLTLSHNLISEIGVGSFKNINLLDLSHNRLSEIHDDVIQRGTTVQKLRLSSNNFTALEEGLFSEKKISAVYLDPNPWQCPSLRQISKWASKYGTEILRSKSDVINKRSYAMCFCSEDINPLECTLI